MRPVGVLVCGALSLPTHSVAQAASPETSSNLGSICVLPNSPERPTRFSPGGEYNPYTFTVRVDKRRSILWPHEKPLFIENLDMQDDHLVVLTSDGKRIQSFRFKFSDYNDAKLCVAFRRLSRGADGKSHGRGLVQGKEPGLLAVGCGEICGFQRVKIPPDRGTGSHHRRSPCIQRRASKTRDRTVDDSAQLSILWRDYTGKANKSSDHEHRDQHENRKQDVVVTVCS